MRELPEKIWAWFFMAHQCDEGIIDGGWCSEFDHKGIEYVRADVAAAQIADARNAALNEAIEAITFEAEGRKKQMDAHEHDAVQHERFRIGELQSRLNVKNVAALKTEPTP